jgi:lipoprotein-anchoring transpeptidase ErfK/SrfK
MSKLIKSLIGAAIVAAGLASPALANNQPFQGIVLVPPGTDTPVTTAPAAENFGFRRGKIVDFATEKPAGSVIILTRQHALYYVLGNGKAVKYRVATAKPGFEWSGVHRVSNKVVWPEWRPPVEMRQRRPELPEYMAGGPENPLGARAIYLGSSIYRIHGTNEPSSIGKSASSGCIRMLNADVQELYRNIRLGALVVVM